MDKQSIQHRMLEHVKTFVWFSLFCMSLPFLLLSFSVVSIANYICIAVLAFKYPNLEFVRNKTVSSLLDTKRNQCFVHVVLQLEGDCDIVAVKLRLQRYLLDRKDRIGTSWRYPRLRQTFTTCCGYYAWYKDQNSFNISNHVILGPSTFRGRPITDLTIQECVSSIVSKYMLLDIPQWQIIFFPITASGSTISSYYMLVRMHHLLLAEGSESCLLDLLRMDTLIPPPRLLSTSETERIAVNHRAVGSNPLRNIVKPLVHLPKLYNQFADTICNQWNEFVFKNEPKLDSNVSQVDMKPISGCIQLLSILVIASVTVVRDFCKGFNATKHEPAAKMQFLIGIVRREIIKRQLSWSCIGNVVRGSIRPTSLVRGGVSLMWRSCVLWCYKLPLTVYTEAVSCVSYLIGSADEGNPNILMKHIQLLVNAGKELLHVAGIVVTAPKFVIEEMFERRHYEMNAVQNVSLNGRKVVAWSRPIHTDALRRACSQHGNNATEMEIHFVAMSSALQTLLEQYKNAMVPDRCAVCARAVCSEYQLGKKLDGGIAGYVCMNLPMKMSPDKQILSIRKSMEQAREKQVGLYALHGRSDLLTGWLPAVLLQVLFNYLSKKFAITITQVEEAGSVGNLLGGTVWGHRIKDVIFFTTPQSNIGVSLTLQDFGNHVRLSVMSDAQFSPHHTKIADAWANYFHNL